MNYHVTGNEYVALPTLREADAALESLSFLHMRAKGMLELCGTQEAPLRSAHLSQHLRWPNNRTGSRR